MEFDAVKMYSPAKDTDQMNKVQMAGATPQQPTDMETRNIPHNSMPFLQKNLLGPKNTVTTCQFCHASIKTAVKYTTTTRTHIAAALCGLICCCCCIPYASDSAKNADHYCPVCQRYLGTYEK